MTEAGEDGDLPPESGHAVIRGTSGVEDTATTKPASTAEQTDNVSDSLQLISCVMKCR